MEQKIREVLKNKPFLKFTLLALLPFACIESLKIYYVILSYIISFIMCVYAWEHRKDNGKTQIIWGITAILFVSLSALLSYQSTALIAYGVAIFTTYAMWYNWNWYGIILAAFGSLFVVSSFNSYAWEIPYTITMFIYGVAVLCLYSCIVGQKASIVLYYVGHVIFNIINIYYHKYRFAYVTISDILSLRTFFNVAGQYHFQWMYEMTVFLIMGVICLTPFLFIKGYKIVKKWRLSVISGICAVVFFLIIGLQTYQKWTIEHTGTGYFDMFAMSVVEELKIITDQPNMEEQVQKVQAFTPDTWDGVKPNIVTIMCESYSDVVKIRGLHASEDPVDPLWKLGETDPNAKTGLVHINTVGGGTSVSEWEYQTGLNHSLLSISRVPFFTDCAKNYTFSADQLYSDYYKLYMHPFRSSGWNRPTVYKNFDFDEIVFSEDDDPTYGPDDRVRSLVSDKALIKTIINRMETTEQPLFSMNVTMQNHGGYGDDIGGEDRLKEKTVTITDDVEDKEYVENFLTLQKMSTEAIIEFAEYLKAHPEEPTILLFFGDHYPSDIEKPDGSEGYETPYLVYSNFCELADMPETMDLSLFYANVMKAAGLPLSSWDKYLLSLDGKTADRDMILARIKHGYF